MENKYKLRFESSMNEAYNYVDKLEDIVNNLKEQLSPEEFYQELNDIANNEQAYDNMIESAELALNDGYYNAYLTQSLINFVYRIMVDEVIPNRLEVDIIRDYLDELTEEEVIEMTTEIIERKEMD